MEKIAHKLFDQFMQQMQAKVFIIISILPYFHTAIHTLYILTYPTPQTATQACAEELESLAQLLVFKFNHIRGRIKQLADKFLSKVVDK